MKRGLAAEPGVRVWMADWCVELRGLPAELRATIGGHYARFCPPPSRQVDVVCDVEVNTSPHAPPRVASAPDAARVLVDKRDVCATWDRAARRVNLSVSADTAAAGIEYTLRTLCAHLAFDEGALLVHGAGITRGNRAFLFVGPSGAGKTTLARLSTDATVLNDDMVVLKPGPNQWTAVSTPFWNSTQVPPQPGDAPVRAVFRLRHATRPEVAPVRPGVALASLLRAVPVVTAHPEEFPVVIERCRRLLEVTPFAELAFSPDGVGWGEIDARFPD